MKTFEEISKKCPWKTIYCECQATIDISFVLSPCAEENCAPYLMIVAMVEKELDSTDTRS